MKFHIDCSILTRSFTLFAVSIALGLPAFAEESAKDKEQALIHLLQADTPPGDKAIACKKLAIYGSADAVPALSPLLADKQLASWALIALEAIPGSAPDLALREAAGKLQGELLVGVIDSIGVRRDPGAVKILTRKLSDSDTTVASAAAVSLGKIGNPKAATALKRALARSSEAVRPAVAEGSVRCAEVLLADGKRSGAVRLYDAVRKATVPKEKVLEGIRGAILARGDAGIPLLLEQLKSNDRDLFNLGLRVARELPGPAATKAVAGAFRAAPADRQPLVLMALADRGDAAALPIVTDVAARGEKNMRVVAIDILDRLGDPATLPVLLNDATDEDPDISQPALAALTRLAGNNVDSELCSRLTDSTGRMRQALMTISARRGIAKALPVIVQSVSDPDAQIRAAAIQALLSLGGNNEVAELGRALQKSNLPDERAHIEKVLVNLSGRIGAPCVPTLVSLMQSPDAGNRKASLHALVAAGGGAALAAVAAATEDRDQAIQDEAVRTLCSWPNAWPEDAAVAAPLLRTAKNDSNSSHEILAQGGYLQLLLGDEKLSKDDKLAKLQDILPLLQRPEEKITAIAVLQGISAPQALDLLSNFASEPAVANDACMALVQSAGGKHASLSLEQRQKALHLAIQKSTKEETKQKAEEALKNLQ
ncbi:MAG: HEAT repeat domain-containing protein [Limisphaerales bacterium]